MARYTTGDGASFSQIEGRPLVCRFGRRETGRRILGLVRKGTVHVHHDSGATTVLNRSSGVVLLDTDRGLTTGSTDYELAQLALPRELVNEALGVFGGRSEGLVRLPGDGLAPLLHAHLDAMAAHGETLDAIDASAAMHATTSLAMAFLSRVFRRDAPADETFDDSLFVAALRYMEAHAWRADLTASGIARAVGCSRAHLYRIFAERERTIGDALREIRLARARVRLVADPDCPIGLIAVESGYADLSAFGKAFRRRFGVSPRDCRQEAGRDPQRCEIAP